MAAKNIKELFRLYSQLSTDDVSDADVESTYLPQAEDLFQKITSETTSYNETTFTTGDFTLDVVLAEFTSYFVYHTVYHNHVEINTATEYSPALYKYQIHFQKALAHLYMYKPTYVNYSEKSGKFWVSDRYARTNFVAIQDNGD